jgi:hypothetical protein
MEELLGIGDGNPFVRRDLTHSHRLSIPVISGELEEAAEAVFFLGRDFHRMTLVLIVFNI